MEEKEASRRTWFWPIVIFSAIVFIVFTVIRYRTEEKKQPDQGKTAYVRMQVTPTPIPTNALNMLTW